MISAPVSLDAFKLIAQSSLDAIPTGFCVCSADCSLIRYNKRAVELWGRELPLGEPAARYSGNLRRYRPDGEPLHFDSTPVAQAIRSGERVTAAELVIEQPDGTRVPVLMNVQPIKDHAGRVEGAVCSFQELTERKRAEEALRESEAELQSVINRTPFMLVRMQPRPALSLRQRRLCASARPDAQRDRRQDHHRGSRREGSRHAASLCRTRAARRGGQFRMQSRFSQYRHRAGFSSPIGPSSVPKARRSAGSPRCSTSPSSGASRRRWRKRADEQAALYRFTDRLYRAASLNDVYEATLDTIVAALHCRRASIQRFDTDGVMRFAAWRGLSDSYRPAIEGHSPWKADDANPEPVCVSDVDRARFSAAIKLAAKQEGIGAHRFHSADGGRQADRQIRDLLRCAARIRPRGHRAHFDAGAPARLRHRAHARRSCPHADRSGTAQAQRAARSRGPQAHARARPHLERLGRPARGVEFRRLLSQHQSGLDAAPRLERGRDQVDECQRAAASRRCGAFDRRPRAAGAGRADRAHGKSLPPQGRLVPLAAMGHDREQRPDLSRPAGMSPRRRKRPRRSNARSGRPRICRRWTPSAS